MIRNSSSISVSVRAAVGSSMIRTSDLNESALAISTICCCATARPETRARGSRWMWSSSNSAAALRLSAFSSSQKPTPFRRGSRPMKMFWATERWPIRFSSWWMMLIPMSCAARGVLISTSAPLTRIVAGVGAVDPGQDLHERGLAGAVLAHQGVDLAGPELEPCAVERVHAREALGDVGHLDQEIAHRVPLGAQPARRRERGVIGTGYR